MIQGGVVLHGNPLLPERHFGCLSLKHFNSRLRPDWLNRDTLKCSQLFSKRIQQLHWTTHKFCILHLSQFVFCIWAGPQTKDIGGHSRLVCTRVDQISTKFSGVASALITPRYIAVYFAANNIFFPLTLTTELKDPRYVHWIGIHKTLCIAFTGDRHMANLEFTLGDFSDMLGHLRDVLAMSGNFCPCSIIMQISFVQSLLNESKLNVKF